MTAQTYEGFLHDFRKKIDECIVISENQIDNKCNGKNCGREMALVRTKLQEAKMWTGKCLEAIGNELPKEYQDKS